MTVAKWLHVVASSQAKAKRSRKAHFLTASSLQCAYCSGKSQTVSQSTFSQSSLQWSFLAVFRSLLESCPSELVGRQAMQKVEAQGYDTSCKRRRYLLGQAQRYLICLRYSAERVGAGGGALASSSQPAVAGRSASPCASVGLGHWLAPQAGLGVSSRQA